MAKITWTFKNEEGTNLNRYIATNVSTGEKITFDLLRGGNISVVGTPLNAENLNALITSINACYDLISSSEKDTTYTLSKNGNAIRLTSSSGAINDVTLGKSDVGLGNVDNTSDMDKPISNATQKALNNRVPITRKINDYSLNADITLNKSDVGLTNVDNTSDLDKPISNDTKKALAGKADLVNGKLPVSQLPDSGITVDVAKKVIYKEEAKDIEEIFDEELNEDLILDIECDHEFEITAQTGHEYSLAIPDESSVKLKKIQGQTRRKSLNLFDNAKSTKDYYCYYVTGEESEITDNSQKNRYYLSNYIEVISNSVYWHNCKVELHICFYDKNKNFISGLLSANKFTTPSNCCYIRITMNSSTLGSTNFMLNKGSTALPYEPYDNTLVNAKCDFVSASKNFFDKSTAVRGQALSSTGGLYTASDAFSSDFIRLPKGTYTVSRENENYAWYNKYDMNKVYTGQAPLSTNIVIDFDGYIRFSGMKDYIDNVILNYGTEPKPYVPHEKDTLIFSQEMGKFDSWENGVFTKGQSEFKTLNGSEDGWYRKTTSDSNWRFVYRHNYNPTPYSNNDQILTASNWTDNTANSTWGGQIGLAIDTINLFICNTDCQTVEELKSWLSQNPITFAYKLATPTTQELPFTNIMKVWNSGLQQQKIEGKYLPYILTKEYAISLKAQVDNNTTENYLQDARIKENKAEIENLKTASVDYTRVYISEEGIYLNEKIRDVDYSIEELERRLDSLGFKEGVCTFTPSNAFQSLTTNTVKKQGKYVILNIDGNIASGTETFTINLPDGFSPKENIVIISILNNTYFSPLNYDINNPGKITVIKTAGQYVLPFKIYNTGWETE